VLATIYVYISRKKKGEKGSKEGKRPISNEGKDKGEGQAVPEEVVKDPAKEAEILLMQR